MAEMPGLLTRWESIFKSIEGKLDTLGVHRARIDSLTPEERTFVTRYFQAYVSPVISPLVIDPRHPFPNLRNGAVYLAALGGAGALMAQSVKTLEVIAWPDLGCEAVRRLTVEKMPLTVILDAHGGDLYTSGPAAYLETVK